MTVYQQAIAGKLPTKEEAQLHAQQKEGEVKKEQDQWKEWSENPFTQEFVRVLEKELAAHIEFVDANIGNGNINGTNILVPSASAATLRNVIKLIKTGKYK